MFDIQMIVLLLGIIVIVVFFTHQSIYPTSLYLVLAGILLSPFLQYPLIEMHPKLVLNVFLPLLLYGISTQFSINEFKKNVRPILLLSIGHVIFITVLVASVLHYCIPQLSWPLAFIIGSVISPPDDVAIANIAEKIKLPYQIVNILEGEGMLNDATALILFRFSLIALMTHQFSSLAAALQFSTIVVGETAYGVLLGNLLGKGRAYLKDPVLHILVSLLTPFIAYLPAERLGGTGVVSTVITGIIIGNYYSIKFTHEFRLLSQAIWPALLFMIQNFLFLLVGINIDSIYQAVSTISLVEIIKFTGLTVATVIIGRFIWVFPAFFLPRWLFAKVHKKQSLPWQYPMIVGWAGMRGGISLAAALMVPVLPVFIDNVNARDLVIFLVFMVIFATLVIQGLSLPWLIKKIGLKCHAHEESHREKSIELTARLSMAEAALAWLKQSQTEIQDDAMLLEELVLHQKIYEKLKENLIYKLAHHQAHPHEKEVVVARDLLTVSNRTVEVERQILIQLWQDGKLSLQIRNKLLLELDLRTHS